MRFSSVIIPFCVGTALSFSAYPAAELPSKTILFLAKPPEEIIKNYSSHFSGSEPEEVIFEFRLAIARDQRMREWLYSYFKKEPLLEDSLREEAIWFASILPAEWSLRFLVDLTYDDRHVKSLRHDYESADFQQKVRDLEAAVKESRNIGSSQEKVIDTPDLLTEFYEETGLKGRNNNDGAMRSLLLANLVGAPKKGGIDATVDWLRKSSQRNRLSEIAKATWGERALLNSEIGLGPDNKPLAESNAAEGGTRPAKDWKVPAASVAETTSLAAERGYVSYWIAAGSVLLLAIAGFVAFRRRSAGS